MLLSDEGLERCLADVISQGFSPSFFSQAVLFSSILGSESCSDEEAIDRENMTQQPLKLCMVGGCGLTFRDGTWRYPGVISHQEGI